MNKQITDDNKSLYLLNIILIRWIFTKNYDNLYFI